MYGAQKGCALDTLHSAFFHNKVVDRECCGG